MALKIRRDDTVRIITGKDRGKTGRVLRVDPEKHKVFVEGANIVKRHIKPRTLRDTQRAQEMGGIVEMEGPIHISNVMLIDPDSGEPTRVGIKRGEGGKRAARGQEVRQGDRLMEASAPAAVPPRLKERYEAEIKPSLQKRFGYKTVMEVPRLEKITLNMGVGDAKQDSNVLDAASEQLATIAGQAPNVRRAKKSIANFKLRDGMPVGVSVTLRRAYMWEFLDRLTSIAIPRIRDFRGLNARSFDGRGNYSMGVREQIIFPEIDYDAIDQTRGLDVTITTSAQTDEEAYVLLRELGMPFSPDGAPGSEDQVEEDEAEEERRHEEARLKAEAEAAAYEQLKEENPEAYETPTPSEDEDEAETGEETQGVMAKTSQRVRQQRGSKYKTRNYNRCKRCGRPRAYLRKFGLCRICLREIAHEGMIPGLTKSSW